MGEKIVVALGGNALQSGKAEPTAEAQLKVVRNTCERIADISEMGYEVAVVHGNGPQVGRYSCNAFRRMRSNVTGIHRISPSAGSQVCSQQEKQEHPCGNHRYSDGS